MLKLSGAIGLNMFAPMFTLTGTVTVLLAALNTTCPVKVPASSPLPGRAEFTIPTLRF
jgi:hypothetical protein